MANEGAERESLMRRPVSSWTGNGPNSAVPLTNVNSRGLQFQPQILGQSAMQQAQHTGNSLQQWRMNLHQQPQRFPQTIPGALPNTPMAYAAQTRPPAVPFVDPAVADAAAAVAAARSRLSQNHTQAQRTDPTLYTGPTPNAAASNAAAAVFAHVRQQQSIPNPPQNPQQILMQTAPLANEPWKALAARPQLPQPLHLPSMPIHSPGAQPVRPPTMLGPQMPTPFPGQVPPQLVRPPFAGSPPPPSRPTLITDQPRLIALMAEYSNRLASNYPMMPPRPTLPMALPSVRPGLPVYPATTGNPIRPGYQPPTSLTVPSTAFPSPRPVLPTLGIPVGLPGSLPNATVPSGLINLQPKPPISMGWPDARVPPIHPGLVRSNSAPPIPPQYFNPLIHYGHVPFSDFSRMGVPNPMAFQPTDPMFAPEQCAPEEGHTPETLKAETKEPSACASQEREEEVKQQRAVSRDSLRVRPSASHGDAERDGLAHRRHQPASQSRSGRAWSIAAKSIRSRRPDDVSDEDPPAHRKFVLSADPVGAVTDEFAEDLLIEPEEPFQSDLVEHNFVEPEVDGLEFPEPEEYPELKLVDKEFIGVKPEPTESRNVVISEFNRHAALVEDTVETMSEDGPTLALNKHRKVATQRNPRRRAVLRPTVSNSALATTNDALTTRAFGATFSVVMSLQYAKFVIVLGLVLPVSELLSQYIRPYSYQAFYLYLYLGSILFMVYINISAAWRRRVRLSIEKRKASDPAAGTTRSICHTASRLSRLPRLRIKRDRSESEDVRYGSVYLRIGVNAFGIGSMVYCGLEIAREIEHWTMASSPHPSIGQIDRPVRLLLPACRAALTILQMHFILFNDKASEIRRQRTPARIGLAHMIATNVCEWLGVVVQETRHEIVQLGAMGATAGVSLSKDVVSNSTISHHNSAVSDAPEGIVGPLLHTVAPLLSPCTIEYSLICAVLLFEMWKEVGQAEDDGSSTAQESQSVSSAGGTNIIGDSPVVGALATVGATAAIAGPNYPGGPRIRGAHQLSADLTHSQRGAFCGILLLVLTLLGVALLSAQRSLNMGVIADPSKAALVQLPYDAVLEAILSSTVLLGVIVVAVSTRKLAFDNVPAYPLPLDLFLLVAAQTSAYVYSLFVIIGCYVLLRNTGEPIAVHYHAAVILGVEALSTLRAYAQTHVIVRAWHRRPTDARQANEKPGRQAVTFLLFANLCLWAASTFGSARAQRLPHHMRLFGVLPWTAIAHACLPLTIFLHLHSSICLFEMWKNCYKFRPD